MLVTQSRNFFDSFRIINRMVSAFAVVTKRAFGWEENSAVFDFGHEIRSRHNAGGSA